VIQGCMSSIAEATPIILTGEERTALESLAGSTKTEYRSRVKAHIDGGGWRGDAGDRSPVTCREGSPMSYDCKSPEGVLKTIKDNKIEMVDLRSLEGGFQCLFAALFRLSASPRRRSCLAS
jgi:hypothetical protein